MSRSLGCAGCGTCCEVIKLSFDPRERAMRAMDHRLPERRKQSSDDDDTALNWEFFAQAHWAVEWFERSRNGLAAWVVTCRAYDAIGRRCTIHADRPPICRDYPFYSHHPDRQASPKVDHPDHPDSIHRVDGVASCSYYLDLPGWADQGARPLLPLIVLTTGKEL